MTLPVLVVKFHHHARTPAPTVTFQQSQQHTPPLSSLSPPAPKVQRAYLFESTRTSSSNHWQSPLPGLRTPRVHLAGTPPGDKDSHRKSVYEATLYQSP